jgi:hypothetical protein
MSELIIFGTLKYSNDDLEKIKSLKLLEGNLSIEARGAIASLLKSSIKVSSQKPTDKNLARIIIPTTTVKNADGSSYRPFFYLNKKPELSKADAINLLEKANILKNFISPSKRDEILKQNIKNSSIEGMPVATLNTEEKRKQAYDLLVKKGKATPLKSSKDLNEIINNHYFYAIYEEKSA